LIRPSEESRLVLILQVTSHLPFSAFSALSFSGVERKFVEENELALAALKIGGAFAGGEATQ
jgi:hypothetical protein